MFFTPMPTTSNYHFLTRSLRLVSLSLGLLLVVCSTTPVLAQTDPGLAPETNPSVAKLSAPPATIEISGSETNPIDTTTSPQSEAEQFKLLERQDDWRVWQKERLEKEISNVRVIYRGQLEIYRAQEKTFSIAQDQYRKLQTLDSIEQAVRSTRQAMLSRDQVLFTYLTLLKLRLIDSEGVEISYKQTLIERIDALLTQLQQHHAKTLKEFDRQRINTLSDEFIPIGADIKTTVSHALSALNLGKLQSVYDRSVLLFDEIQAEVTNTEGALTAAEKQRSITEIQRTLDTTSTNLKKITAKVGQRMADKSEIYAESDLIGDLNTTYSLLSKILGFFSELLKRSAP